MRCNETAAGPGDEEAHFPRYIPNYGTSDARRAGFNCGTQLRQMAPQLGLHR